MTMAMRERLRRASEAGAFRMKWWGAVAILSSAIVLAFYPQQAGPMLLKLNLLALAAWTGYWIDRAVFPYSRPHLAEDAGAAEIRRAVIIGAAMLSVALAI